MKRFKKFIKIMCVMLSIMMIVVSQQNVYAISILRDSIDSQFEGEELNLIKRSIQYLNNHDYKAYTECFGDTEKSVLSGMLTPYYIKNNIGYLNVKNIYLVSINKDNGSEAICNEDISEYDNVSYYKVTTNVSTYKDDIFYYNGTRTDIYCIGRKNTEYVILSITSNNGMQGECEKGHDMDANLMGISAVCSIIPKTIKVRIKKNTISTVDFKEYVQKVSVEEVGFDERADTGRTDGIDGKWGAEWQKACVLAVKTYAIYYYLRYDPNKGYHVTDTQQIYKASADINTCPNVKKAIDSTWYYVIFDYEKNIVEAEYRSGTISEHDVFKKQYSGKLHQLDAWEMAKKGKTYQQILAFYYSQKDKPISIDVYEKHTWINQNGVVVCKNCGKKNGTNTTSSFSSLYKLQLIERE